MDRRQNQALAGSFQWRQNGKPSTFVSPMNTSRHSLFFVALLLLTFLTGKNVQAAPIPFLPYDLADSTDAVLRLAEIEAQPWVTELQNIRINEQEDRADEALAGYEQLIRNYVDDAGALEFLVPLYWRQAEFSGETVRRRNLFLDLAGQSEQWLFLALAEDLIQHHTRWRLSSEWPKDHHEDDEIWLKIRDWYDQLLFAIQSPAGEEPEIFLQVWLNALLYFHAPSGGLASADAYLLNQAGQAAHPELITLYRKMLHDLAGQPIEAPPEWQLAAAWSRGRDDNRGNGRAG